MSDETPRPKRWRRRREPSIAQTLTDLVSGPGCLRMSSSAEGLMFQMLGLVASQTPDVPMTELRHRMQRLIDCDQTWEALAAMRTVIEPVAERLVEHFHGSTDQVEGNA